MNKHYLIGRLTRDPETSVTQGGKKIAKFSLAVNRRGKDGADYFNIVSFDKIAEIVDNYCHKGKQVAIEGTGQTGKYQDKNGATHYTYDVIVNNLELLGSKEDSPKQEEKKQEESENDWQSADITDKDLPF